MSKKQISLATKVFLFLVLINCFLIHGFYDSANAVFPDQACNTWCTSNPADGACGAGVTANYSSGSQKPTSGTCAINPPPNPPQVYVLPDYTGTGPAVSRGCCCNCPPACTKCSDDKIVGTRKCSGGCTEVKECTKISKYECEYQQKQVCGANSYCNTGSCTPVKCNLCDHGSKQCAAGPGTQNCGTNADLCLGGEWSATTNCAAGETCSQTIISGACDGQCKATPTPPKVCGDYKVSEGCGGRTCSSALLKCDADGGGPNDKCNCISLFASTSPTPIQVASAPTPMPTATTAVVVASAPTPMPTATTAVAAYVPPSPTYTPPMYARKTLEEGEESAETRIQATDSSSETRAQVSGELGSDVNCGKTKPPQCGGTCKDPDKVCVSKFNKEKKKMICKCRKQNAAEDENDSGDDNSEE